MTSTAEHLARHVPASASTEDVLPLPQGLPELLSQLDPGARILDFGCGTGRLTAQLLAAGYDVCGADISERQLARARRRLEEAGAEAERAALLGADGRSPFPDGSFDLVFSSQVLEHVEQLDVVVREIARVTRAGGVGLHEWPAKWAPVEVHLRMPFVHWLPKNRVRRAAMSVFARLGVRQPQWPEELDPSATLSEFVDFKYRYSIEETFYRPARAVAAVFERRGLTAEFVPHSRLDALPLGPARPLAERAVRTFRTVTLRTRKAAG